MKLVMLSAFDVAKAVFQLLKIKLCWSDEMLAEISGCMLKTRSNKAKPKKLTHRLSMLMMLFHLSKAMLNPKEVVLTMLLKGCCCVRC